MKTRYPLNPPLWGGLINKINLCYTTFMKTTPRIKYNLITTLLFVFISLTTLIGCQNNAVPETINGFYFDTFISITLYQPITPELKDNCLALCDKYENMFSAAIDNSDIYKINHANGEPVIVANETIELVELAIHFARLSDGLCDPTIYPLSSLWDYKSDNPTIPDSKSLSDAISHINYQNILISDNTITLHDPDAQIDLGFIAKGYIADKLKEYLLSQNITSGIINLGGNVLLIGSKPGGEKYNIGIEYPFGNKSEPITSVSVADVSVVTSGIYERYFENNGQIYHHILNPFTGYPENNQLYSVTIVGPSSAICDALSTTVFLLGIDKCKELMVDYPDYQVIFVTNEYQVISN